MLLESLFPTGLEEHLSATNRLTPIALMLLVPMLSGHAHAAPTLGSLDFTSGSSRAADSSTLTFTVVRNQTVQLNDYVEYDATSCTEIDEGSWTLNTVPKYGSVSLTTISGTLKNGDCPGVTFDFAAISYTWTSKKGKMYDSFSATYNSQDYTVPDNFKLILSCGSDALGQELDALIAEYTQYADRGLKLRPTCSDFTRDAHTVNYTFHNLNFGDKDVIAYPDWAILVAPLIAPEAEGYGLDEWVSKIGTLHRLNSGYRNPARNFDASVNGAPNSPHMYGVAADLQNVSKTPEEYNKLADAAHNSHADFVEPPTKKFQCRLKCVHADWRCHPGSLGPDVGCPSGAASMRVPRSRSLEEIDRMVASARWQTRRQAFEAAAAALAGTESERAATNRLHQILIHLLGREAASFNSEEDAGEEYSEYVARLVWQVSALKDSQALAVLLRPAILNTGEMAISGVAYFGDAAIDRVIEQYEKPTPLTSRTVLLRVVVDMLGQRSVVAPQNLAKVRSLLVVAAEDPDEMVRIAAVDGLQYFPGEQTVAILEKLRASDPYNVHLKGKRHYPVRSEAKTVLERMTQ